MNLFAELTRRNVIRAAGLYLVGAWLLVQVAGTVLPWFNVPQANLRGLVILLAVGFLPAMIVAWVFELTPSGLKRDEDVIARESMAPHNAKRMDRLILIVAVIALGYFGFDKFVLAPGRDATLVTRTAAHVTAKISAEKSKIDPRSIAVLPFINMSKDNDNEYFSDGISEELLNVLVRVQGFNVASRTSSFAFKGRELGTTEIAKALKVKYILEGSVRKQGDQVRITAQLIDAASDRHLMSQTYDRKLSDIFKIQDEIANAIVTAVRGSVDDTSRGKAVTVAADTSNLDAYQSYLKARELFIARRDLPDSVRLFERAVELDPKFARGWEGLAAVSSVMRSWGYSDRDYQTLTKEAAERALALDASLSMPWAALANVESQTWPVDYTRNLMLLDKAIDADPRNATALHWRSIKWIHLGFFDRALADQDRCLALEPGYYNCRSHKALTLLLRGEEDAAFALFERNLLAGFAASRAEHFVAPLVHRGNRIAAALLLDSLDMKPEQREIVLASISRSVGPRSLPKSYIDRYLSDPEDPLRKVVGLSHFYLWLGDFDRVGAEDDSATSTIIPWERYPASFRNSPGMKMKLVRMGVTVYWRKHGYPPQCHAVGAQDFTCQDPALGGVQ